MQYAVHCTVYTVKCTVCTVHIYLSEGGGGMFSTITPFRLTILIMMGIFINQHKIYIFHFRSLQKQQAVLDKVLVFGLKAQSISRTFPCQLSLNNCINNCSCTTDLQLERHLLAGLCLPPLGVGELVDPGLDDLTVPHHLPPPEPGQQEHRQVHYNSTKPSFFL